MKSWSAGIALLLSMGIATTAVAENSKWNPWFEFGGYYGTDEASRGEAVLFMPLSQNADTLIFTDLRGKLFEHGAMEGNLALGYRQMFESGFNYGAWIGADLRHTEYDNTFWQMSGGCEALSDSFDARFNWYGPATSSQRASGNFADVMLEGNNIFMVGGQEVPLHGVDAEVGIRLPVANDAGVLGLYVGGYYFDHHEAYKSVKGPKARVELAMDGILPGLPGSRLTAEYEYSNDDLRQDRHQIGLRLRIPLGAGSSSKVSLTRQARRMVAGLERDTDIVFGQSKKEYVEDALTNTDFDRVAFVNNGGSITTESAAAGDNSLLIVNGTISDGTTQTVQANQTVQGGGSTIQVRGRSSGAVAGFTAAGSKPTVINTNTSAGDVISLAGDNTHIAGLLIDGNNNGDNNVAGIDGGDNKTNIFITQNVIQNIGVHETVDGVSFGDNNSNVTVSGNTISNVGRNGVTFSQFNSNVTVSGNTISNIDNDGVLFIYQNSNVTVSGNTISDIGDNGDGDGVKFYLENSNVTVSGNTISNTANHGVIFFDDNSNVTVSGNTISNTDSDGVRFQVNNSNVLVSGNTFTDIGSGDATDHVFDFYGVGNTLLPGSTGNVVTTAPNAGNLCGGAGSFTGSLEVTDHNGVSQTFVNGCP